MLFDSAKAAPILEVAQRLGLTVYRGNLIHCPEHKAGDGVDEHASCGLNPRTNRFRCFACGNHGSTVDLVLQVLKKTPREAAEWIGGTEEAPAPQANLFLPQEQVSAILADLIHACGAPSEKATEYLKGRGIDPRFALDVHDYAGVQKALLEKHSKRDLVACGVFSSKGHLKFYRHPLLFPFYLEGKPVFLTARRWDDEKPKYLSINGEIPCLFNQDALTEPGEVWLCEGITDTLTLASERKVAVGIIGAFGFKRAWASLLAGRDVILALDGDDAGRAGTEFIQGLMPRVRVAQLNPGADVNSYYQATGLLPEPSND